MVFDIASSFHPNVPHHEGSTSSQSDIHILSENFWKALNAAHQPIWPGNSTETKLSATVKLLNIKSENNWSERGVNQNLDYIKSLLPEDNVLPDNFYTMKKLVEDLGLPVTRIDICRDGCMLFWRADSELESCKFCNFPRYKENSNQRTPHKQLFYLPLAPRLQRLYASNVTAAHMTWHSRHVTQDGMMCHPSDGEAWKTFDNYYPEFAKEDRNIRLGLCSDGFAPFGKSYSCWPVIITPYNLPPGMCMKTPYMFMSLIIPGPKSPQKNIDVYLQPLIVELKMLWNDGVPTYDVSRGDTFNLRAMVLWTVSDFPAYGILSGWSTHGKDGCPICMKNSKSFRLKYGKKACYFDSHRQFLSQNHPYRFDTEHFTKNKVEMTLRPPRPSGEEIWSEIAQYMFVSENPHVSPPGFGEYHKWTKKSIFWELPYWGKLLIRHNLDFMHIEKNVFENIIHTVMNVKGKTKDNINARKDMFNICNRPELHIDPQSSCMRTKKAAYTLTRDENRIICQWLKSLKFPDERLVPIAFKKLLPKFVWGTLTDVSNFMHDLSSTTLNISKMQTLELEIPVILCNLEKIFPLSFFDSMEHLLVHLPYEAKIGGPVQYRWMYPFERFLKNVNQKVKNKARIEASICNAYILEEISTFASYYFESNIQCKQRHPQRNTEGSVNNNDASISIFNYLGRSSGASTKLILNSQETLVAHTYVLLNCPEVDPYYSLPKDEIDRQFASWFRCKIVEEHGPLVSKGLLYYLSFGPKTPATRHSMYFVNGFVWRSRDFGSNKATMNSGVCVHTDDADYYGLLEDIIEIEYPGPSLRIVLFKCLWFDPTRGSRVDETYRLVDINMKRKYAKYDPFILAQQGIQARGKIEKQWSDDLVYQQEEPTIQLDIPLNIPLYDVNNLSDPNGMVDELDDTNVSEENEFEDVEWEGSELCGNESEGSGSEEISETHESLDIF
ncbi:uncharacterized protein LOC124946061 [Impatiens glandulifera]|uniref:uncharacterized protein LOC124946061 n=1 Tax=Impatiens glandulifera TaxID=253017 RepID=UPI001FB14BAC|nr:uncharacterized protein LOC124946061 [Impatiens glandulifera]